MPPFQKLALCGLLDSGMFLHRIIWIIFAYAYNGFSVHYANFDEDLRLRNLDMGKLLLHTNMAGNVIFRPEMIVQ